jgi:PAS domain S-box-containing protein
MQFLPLLNSISILISLTLIYFISFRWFRTRNKWKELLSGSVFGLATIGVMINSIEIVPGLFLDIRTIILPLAGLFGGPIVAATAGLISSIYRLWVGGPGVFAGVMVIITSTLAGIIFFYLLNKRIFTSPVWAYVMLGFIVHLIMFLFLSFIPTELRNYEFFRVLYPLLILLPLVFLLICLLFHEKEKSHHAVDQLAESQKRFQQLFYHNPAAFLLIDPQTNDIIDANHAALNFYGWNIDEIKSKKISDINTLPTDRIKQNMDLAASQNQKHFFFQHRLANGQIRDVEVFSGPIVLNQKMYLYSIVHDITERKKAEKKLIQSEVSYKGLFNAVKDAIYIQNIQGVFLDVNEGVERMYGYSKEEIIGKSPDFLSAPVLNDSIDIKGYFEKALAGLPASFEFWGKKRNGDVFPKLVKLYKGTYFDEDVIIAIAQDVTDNKRTEKLIRESQENLKHLSTS